MSRCPILFDVNANFGYSASARPDFTNAQALLSHMDRLGIAHSLVWQAQAMDYHASLGNRKLLDQIDATPQAAGRLYPAFTIVPSMLYENGAMDELRHAVSSGRVRALRFFPGRSWAHTLTQIEPVVEAVAPYNPLLLLDGSEAPQGLIETELIDFAQKFSNLTIVYMQGMWVNLVSMYTLMARCDNIAVDLSFLHTRGSIGDIVQRFGAHRLLFGTGPKAHNGASIAALANAELSDAERADIAYRNLQRLLGISSLTPAPAPPPNALNCNPLWNRLCQAAPIQHKCIDAHGHLGAYDASVMAERDINRQVPQLIKHMDQLGIQKIIVSGEMAYRSDPVQGHKDLIASIGAHWDRFSGYLAYNPHYAQELAGMLDEFFADPFFVGFKLHCDTWRVPVTDKRFIPVWQYANAHRLPILLHTWQTMYDAPAMLQDIVGQYPQAYFLLGHGGGTDVGREQAEALALAHNNVYLEWCGSFLGRTLWEDTIRRVGSDRVLFGSDTCLHDQAWELGRLLSLDLPAEMIEPILYKNITHILKQRI